MSTVAAPPKKRFRLLARAGGFDMPFFVLLIILLGLGLACLFSASHVYAYYRFDDSYYFILPQLGYVCFGLAVMFAVSFVDYHLLHRFAMLLMIVSLGLLVVALFMPKWNGSHRWINLGFIQFQPSEVAKFALILAVSHMVTVYERREEGKGLRLGQFVPMLLLIVATTALVGIEPHISGAILILACGLIPLFLGGAKWRHLLGSALLGGGAAAALAAWKLKSLYANDRIVVWQNPFEAYKTMPDKARQMVNALYAVGSGGILGRGWGNSVQKHMWLPELQNDFIFAIICEELGLVGALILMLLFGALVVRGLVIARRAPDRFGSLLAAGLSMQVGLQVVLNFAVVTGLVPNTGISLPFFSAGGTSLLMMMAQMGVVLGISRQGKGKGQKPEARG